MTPPAARAGMTRQTPAVAGRAIVTTRPGQAGIAVMLPAAAGMTRPAGARHAAGQAIVTVRPGRIVIGPAGPVGRAGMTGRTAMAVAALAGRAGMTGRTAARVMAGRAGQAAIAVM